MLFYFISYLSVFIPNLSVFIPNLSVFISYLSSFISYLSVVIPLSLYPSTHVGSLHAQAQGRGGGGRKPKSQGYFADFRSATIERQVTTTGEPAH
jgi:hypothetical protein